MARTGLSKFIYAKYSYNPDTNKVSYADGVVAARMVSANVDPGDDGSTDFYSDNGVSESSTTFGKGTLTMTADRLDLMNKANLVGAAYDSEKGIVSFGADDIAPFVGVGFIVRLQRSNTLVWKAVVLPKVKFHRDSLAATTSEETVNFSGEDLEGDIYRDDERGVWKDEYEAATEDVAFTWIKGRLSITT